jgi:glutamate racemase
MKNNLPIGIFDSGIGGLTVASAISRELPGENLIYFGDTAHMPYGDKSPETILKYSKRIVDFLHSHYCKTIVIACNTASALAADRLREIWKEEILFINVIDPVVEFLKENGVFQDIGIIGTKGTIHSGIYPEKLKKALPGVKISSMATPLLAPLIEEGYFNNNISSVIIEDYLKMEPLRNMDCLVLACTHYPLIKAQIQSILGPEVFILDSSEWVARFLHKELKKRGWLNNTSDQQSNAFYVSDFTESFQKSTEIFFGNQIHLQKINLP